MRYYRYNFKEAYKLIADELRHAVTVDTGTWQGKTKNTKTRELLNTGIEIPCEDYLFNLDKWREEIKPNLPWADNHFLERVQGFASNPGKEWRNWPYARYAEKSLNKDGMFNHNYMERYWPKYVYGTNMHTRENNFGIRQPYGDLQDLLNFIDKYPHTRQAYLPVYFPEDTGAEERKPCSLGYHFIVRENKMHINYYMRSCDFVRHFRDDVYLTLRLLLWVIQKLRNRNGYLWDGVIPGNFTMTITSLHCFLSDDI